MALKYYFYILMLLLFLAMLGAFTVSYGPYTGFIRGGLGLVEFLLFAILGYKVFGPAVQG